VAETNGVIAPSLNVPQPMQPIGVPGLRGMGGYVREEFLQELSGPTGVQTFKKMRDNSPIIGAILFATEMLVRPVGWSCTPADDSQEAADLAAFARHALFDDCLNTWYVRLSDILSMLPFGWALMEWTLKRRQGPHRDPWRSSSATDGRLGFADIGLRSQDTLMRWDVSERDEVQGMVQQPPNGGPIVTIPRAKSLLFRPTSYKSNPEGRSILRTAYRPWYNLTQIENIEGIGIERDLAGLPVVKVPPEVMAGHQAGATAEARMIYQQYEQLAVNIRQNEQAGIVFPLVYDAEGHELYKLELLSSGGRRNFDTDTVIKRYELRIAQSVLADMILVGHEQVGSYALASSKTNLFATALGGYLDAISDVFQQEAIPVLWQANGLPLPLMPHVEHGDVEHVDIKELSEAIKNMAQAGFDVADLDRPVRLKMGLPAPEEAEELG
jgi:hypothetical protein